MRAHLLSCFDLHANCTHGWVINQRGLNKLCLVRLTEGETDKRKIRNLIVALELQSKKISDKNMRLVGKESHCSALFYWHRLWVTQPHNTKRCGQHSYSFTIILNSTFSVSQILKSQKVINKLKYKSPDYNLMRIF